MRRVPALAVVAMVLAGCSGSGGVEPQPADAAQGGPGVAAAADGTPRPATARSRPPLSPRPSARSTPTAVTAAPPAGPAATPGYLFPVRRCGATYGRCHHDYPAADIFARVGCPVVSVTDGVVDEVSRRDAWTSSVNDGATRGGLSVSVVGNDGVRYYYSHLSAVQQGIAAGAEVVAGQRLGSVGRTGSARGTAPHVHFGLSWPTPRGMWWIRRGMLAPAPFLDAWRDGDDRSPRRQILRLKKTRGPAPACTSLC